MADRSQSSSDANTSGSAVYIEHTVSKLDTLAGVAIKYGVEMLYEYRSAGGLPIAQLMYGGRR